MKPYQEMLAEFEVAPEHDDDEQCPICSAGDGDEMCREAVECLVSDIQDEITPRPDPATVLGILIDGNLLGYSLEECVASVQIGMHDIQERRMCREESSNHASACASTMAKRIQRKRSRGWRMPANTIYIGRPSRYGNPFRVGALNGSASRCVQLYREYMRMMREDEPDRYRALLEPLRGHDLCCWCRIQDKDGNPIPCHGDELLRLVAELDAQENRTMAAMSSDRHYRPDPGYAETHSEAELLQQHIVELETERDEANYTAAILQQRVTYAEETEIPRLRAENDALRKSATDNLAEAIALRDEKTQLEAERDELRQVCDGMERGVIDLAAENVKLGAENAVLRAKLTAANSIIVTIPPPDWSEYEWAQWAILTFWTGNGTGLSWQYIFCEDEPSRTQIGLPGQTGKWAYGTQTGRFFDQMPELKRILERPRSGSGCWGVT